MSLGWRNSTEILASRHGHVAHHLNDNVRLTEEGRRASFEAGARLADSVREGTTVSVLYSDCVRTYETAQEIARGLAERLATQRNRSVTIQPPCPEAEIRNFAFYVDGRELPPTDGMHPAYSRAAERHPYLREFWRAQDHIGYWLTHPDVSVESPAAVVKRMSTCFQRLLRASPPELFVVVTHSGPMRAFLLECFGEDPGEPGFCEAFRVNASGVVFRGSQGQIGWG